MMLSAELDQEGSKVFPRAIGVYHLLFGRVDFRLVVSKNWMMCNQFEARLMRDPHRGGTIDSSVPKRKIKFPRAPEN